MTNVLEIIELWGDIYVIERAGKELDAQSVKTTYFDQYQYLNEHFGYY